MSQSGSPGPERRTYDIPDNFAGALAERYQIERELGRGGMATIYLASDLKSLQSGMFALRNAHRQPTI